jgi:hypothetical protein
MLPSTGYNAKSLSDVKSSSSTIPTSTSTLPALIQTPVVSNPISSLNIMASPLAPSPSSSETKYIFIQNSVLEHQKSTTQEMVGLTGNRCARLNGVEGVCIREEAIRNIPQLEKELQNVEQIHVHDKTTGLVFFESNLDEVMH